MRHMFKKRERVGELASERVNRFNSLTRQPANMLTCIVSVAVFLLSSVFFLPFSENAYALHYYGGSGDGANSRTMAVVTAAPTAVGALYVKLPVDNETLIKEDDQYIGQYLYMTSGTNINKCYLIIDSDERVAGTDGTDIDTITIFPGLFSGTITDGFSIGDSFVIVDRVYTRKSYTSANFNLTKSGALTNQWITWTNNGLAVVDAESEKAYNVNADTGLAYARLSKNIKLLNPVTSSFGGVAVTSTDSCYYMWGDSDVPYWFYTSSSYVHSTKLLSLVFSETVDFSEIDATKIQIGDDSSGTNNFTLASGEITPAQADGATMTFTLTDTHRDAIAQWNSAGKTTLYVKITTPGFKDLAGNAIATTAWCAMGTWTKDTTTPTLNNGSSSYTHSTKLLSLVFNENIDVSATDGTKVQLGDDASGTHNITLAPGEVTAAQSDGTVVTFTLTTAHQDTIAAWNGAGKTTLYVKLTNPAVRDMSGNGIVTTSWLVLGAWTKDTIAPAFNNSASAYDGTTKILSLNFSETMDLNETLLTGSVQLGDDAFGTHNITLALGEITASQSDSSTLTFTLSDAHRDIVSSWGGAGITTLYIKVTTPAFKDLTGNAIATTNWLALNSWTKETTAPTLNSSLSSYVHSTKLLSLVFSETVDFSEIDATKIQIGDDSSGTNNFTLASGEITPAQADGATMTFTLTDTHRDAIAQWNSAGKTTLYVKITTPGFKDLAGNAIATTAWCAMGTWTKDTTTPTLSNWTLNMHTRILTLNFSENVDVSTLDVTALTLQNAASSPAASCALTNSATASSDGTTIDILFSTTDFNALVADTSLAVAQGSSYLSITTSAIDDMSGNNVNAIESSSAQQAASYTANTVTATNFKVTTSAGATMSAAQTKAVVIRAYDALGYRTPAYTGAHTLVFSGANASPAPSNTQPTATNNASANVNFGSDTAVTFANGEGSTTLILYNRQTALIRATEYSGETAVVQTADSDRLSITVNPLQKIQLYFYQEPSTAGTINTPLATQPIVEIRDLYHNRTDDTDEITLYASTSDSYYQDFEGLSATTNPLNATAGQAAFAGVRHNTAETVFYLYAQSGLLTEAFSNGITLVTASTSSVTAADSPAADFNLNPVYDSSAEKFAVLKFKVVDTGGDLTPTLVDRMQVVVGGTGANASTDIVWAGLYAGETQVDTAIGSDITNSMITFGTAPDAGSDADLYSVTDGTSTEFTVYAYMKNTKLAAVEGQTYSFDIDEGYVQADTGTTSGMASDTGAITPVTGTIATTATHLSILDQTSGAASTSMTAGTTKELQIQATDINRNIDTDYATIHYLVFSGLNDVSVYRPRVEGSLFGALKAVNFTAGVSAADAATLQAFKAESQNLTVVDNNDATLLCHALAVTVNAAAPSVIAIVSGNNQEAAVNKQLTNAFVAAVQDTYTNPVANQAVSFSVTSQPPGGSGSLSVAFDDTDASGQASSTLTLGAVAGSYVTQVNYSGGTPVSFTATALNPSAVNIISGNNQSAAVTATLPSTLTVRLVTSSQSGIPGETINFAIINYPSSATGQALSAATAVTNSSGDASIGFTLGNKIGTYTVRASYGALTADFTLTATAGVPYQVVLTGPGSVNAGAVTTAITAAIQDSYANARNVTSATIFNLSTTSATPGAFYSDADGTNVITQVTVAANSNTATIYYKDTTTGAYTLTAAYAAGDTLTVDSDTHSITVLPHDLHHFTVTGSTAAFTAGASRMITVLAKDVYDNIKTDMGATNIVFSGANSSPTPTSQAPTCSNSSAADIAFGTDTMLSFTSGQATTTLKLYKAESVAIVATAGVITTSTTQDLNFTVVHASANHLKSSGNIPVPAGGFIAGTSFPLSSLHAVDLYSNICDGGNGAAAYEGSKALTYSLSGTANSPDGLVNDVYTTTVVFAAGVSNTTLTTTLYRAQSTTITANASDLDGTDAASNSITLSEGPLNKLSFYTQPSTSCLTNVALSTQPVVAVADQYGNPITAANDQITLSASSTTGSYTAVTNGTLSAENLQVIISGGTAAFSNVKYTYPEAVYLRATAVNSNVSATYSYQITFSTASNDGTLSAGDLAEPAAISSTACTNLTRVAIFDFKVTDAGQDGYPLSLTQIAITRNLATDTTGGWSTYIDGCAISDGSTSTPGTVTDNVLTFGSGTSTIYTVANGGYKTFTLRIYLKASMPVGADGKVLGFDLDPNDDISVLTVSSGFAAAGSMTSASTITVVVTKLKVSGEATTMTAGSTTAVTVTATDANNNIDLDYDGAKGIIFSGASNASTGEVPKCTNFSGSAIDFGEGTLVSFLNGVNNVAITMVLYKAEGAAIKATSSDDATITTSASDDYEILVTGGSASKLTWYVQPKVTCVANAPWFPFSVSVADAYGNICSGSVEVTVTPTGGTASALSVNAATTQSGIATFNDFRAYCASYPGSVTLTASAGGLASSNASNVVTIVEKYSVAMRALDSVNGSALTEVTLKVLGAESGALVSLGSQTNPLIGNSPFSFYIPYGAYQFNFNKEAYVETTEEKTADFLADSGDSVYDNAITWTTYIMSISESLADYKVQSNFVYDETADRLSVILRLEKRGQVITSSAINALGSAVVSFYDGSNTILGSLTSTAFDSNGNYWFTVANATAAVPAGFTKKFIAGATYYARLSIAYGGAAGDRMTYYAGNTFTITVTQSLQALTTQIAGLSTDISAQVTGVKTTVAAQEEITRIQIAAVQTDATRLITAAGTTLPALIAATDTALKARIASEADEIQTKLTTEAKSQILTRESVVMLGSTVKIRYRTYPSASPTITVYDPANAARIAAAPMTEVTPGIYEYPVAFVAGWPRGDYSIVCTEATYGTLDAITISAKSSDIENLAGNVSSIMGSVSNVRDIESKVAAFSSAFSAVEENIEKAAAAMAGLQSGSREAADAASQLTSLYTSLKEMSAKIQEMGGTVGYDLQKLYDVNESKAQDIGYIRNKTQELKAMMSLNQQMIENAAKEEPVVQTWFEFR